VTGRMLLTASCVCGWGGSRCPLAASGTDADDPMRCVWLKEAAFLYFQPLLAWRAAAGAALVSPLSECIARVDVTRQRPSALCDGLHRTVVQVNFWAESRSCDVHTRLVPVGLACPTSRAPGKAGGSEELVLGTSPNRLPFLWRVKHSFSHYSILHSKKRIFSKQRILYHLEPMLVFYQHIYLFFP
jgi:hypothetical protein